MNRLILNAVMQAIPQDGPEGSTSVIPAAPLATPESLKSGDPVINGDKGAEWRDKGSVWANGLLAVEQAEATAIKTTASYRQSGAIAFLECPDDFSRVQWFHGVKTKFSEVDGPIEGLGKLSKTHQNFLSDLNRISSAIKGTKDRVAMPVADVLALLKAPEGSYSDKMEKLPTIGKPRAKKAETTEETKETETSETTTETKETPETTAETTTTTETKPEGPLSAAPTAKLPVVNVGETRKGIEFASEDDLMGIAQEFAVRARKSNSEAFKVMGEFILEVMDYMDLDPAAFAAAVSDIRKQINAKHQSAPMAH